MVITENFYYSIFMHKCNRKLFVMDKIISRTCVKSIRTFCSHGRMAKTSLKKPTTLYNVWSKSFSSNPPGSNTIKLTIIGAAGCIGRAVSLMLKQSPLIDEVCLYDTKPTEGFAIDLNHIDTKCFVTSYCGPKDIKSALARSNVVLVLTGAVHRTHLSYENLFEKTSGCVKDIAVSVAKFAPKAVVAIATEPINSIVPMFSEIMKKNGRYNPYSVFGITTIDVVRANKFVSEVMRLDPECVSVPLIGGHTEKTMVPILSKAKPCNNFTNEELEDLTNSVRKANDNITRIRSAEGGCLSKAFAVTRFILSIVKAMRGQNDIVECAFVKSEANAQLKYMVTPLLLGPGGVLRNLGVPDLTDYELCLLENAVPVLAEDIKRGECMGGKCEEEPLCDPCNVHPKSPPCPPDHCELQSMMGGDKR